MTESTPTTELAPQRLDKHLMAMLNCSRHDAALYIAGGWVRVDGVVVEQPQFKVSGQTVALDRHATLQAGEPITILFHQELRADTGLEQAPPIFQQGNRSADDQSGIRSLKSHFSRLETTLPLQPGATGLQIYSQDWRVLRKLKDDAGKIEQEYVVEVSGEMEEGGLQHLASRFTFDGRALPAAKVSWQNETRLRFALKGLQDGQLEFMCASVGLSIVSVKRLRIGRVAMAKLLPGQWRYLPVGERF